MKIKIDFIINNSNPVSIIIKGEESSANNIKNLIDKEISKNRFYYYRQKTKYSLIERIIKWKR